MIACIQWQIQIRCAVPMYIRIPVTMQQKKKKLSLNARRETAITQKMFYLYVDFWSVQLIHIEVKYRGYQCMADTIWILLVTTCPV